MRKLAARGVTIGGISGGPFILAKAGLLDGSLFESDGDRITCSGGVAGLDMMVALITRDHGHELGAAVSDWFLHTHVREGGRPQRMDLRFRLGVADPQLLTVLKAMEAHVEVPLTRERLAKLASVSLRQLERTFRDQLGHGVHVHYLALRLGCARQLLRETSRSMLEIALATGFASASQFSRAFGRTFGFPPREARRRDHRT